MVIRKDLSKKDRKELVNIYEKDKENQLDNGITLEGLVEDNTDTDNLIDEINALNNNNSEPSTSNESSTTETKENTNNITPTQVLPPGTKSFAEILDKAEKIKINKEDAEMKAFYNELHKSFDIFKNGALSDHLSKQQYMTVLEFLEVYKYALTDVQKIMETESENVDPKFHKLFSYMRKNKLKKRDLFQSNTSPTPTFFDLKINSLGGIVFGEPQSIRTILIMLSLGFSWLSFMLGGILPGLISGGIFTILSFFQIRRFIFSRRVNKALRKIKKLEEVVEYDSELALSMIRVGNKTAIQEISIDDLLKKFDEMKTKLGDEDEK